MSDPSAQPGRATETGTNVAPASAAAYPGLPGWVKRSLIVLLVLVVALVLATLLGIHHPGGPGMHPMP